MSAQLWLLAGGNGAGRSTFYARFLEPAGIAFVNADLLARVIAPERAEVVSYDAARLAERIRERLLAASRSFCFETVFSHVSKVDFLARAKAANYRVVLVYIHLVAPQLHLARVGQRVSEGGHAVPDDKVLSRLPRTLANVRRALPLCDELHLLDNSSAEDPFQRVASLVDGQLQRHIEPSPSWAWSLLG